MVKTLNSSPTVFYLFERSITKTPARQLIWARHIRALVCVFIGAWAKHRFKSPRILFSFPPRIFFHRLQSRVSNLVSIVTSSSHVIKSKSNYSYITMASFKVFVAFVFLSVAVFGTLDALPPPCYLQCPHDTCREQCLEDRGSWQAINLECFAQCNPDCMNEKCPTRARRALPPCYLQCHTPTCASSCTRPHESGSWSFIDMDCFTQCTPDCMAEKCPDGPH